MVEHFADRLLSDLAKRMEAVETRLYLIEREMGTNRHTLRSPMLERLADLEQQVSDIQHPRNPMEE